LLLAVSNRGDLVSRNVTFTYDPLCRRQLVVLQEVDKQSARQPLVTPQTSIDGVFDTLARGNTAHRHSSAATAGLDEAVLDGNQREALLKKLSRQMGRGEVSCFNCIVLLAHCVCTAEVSRRQESCLCQT
jgi:hypothetical protein